ncbi:MAG: 50S ribosomal protein L6 [bacterium]|nr:50S ribosomal protein L6 [bacterium]
MSRLAKKPISILSGVTLKDEGGFIVAKGPKGEIKLPKMQGTLVKIEADTVMVTTEGTSKQVRANTGTMWSLIRNAIAGVATGFLKTLEIEGVGYKGAMDGRTLVLSLGFVNPVRITPPEGVTIEVEKNLTIRVSGANKDLVGRTAAEIRAQKKPEPYKGKGIHYAGEVIKRKVGKKAGATAA